MSNCKIICEMPDMQIIHLECKPQDVKDELSKRTNQISHDSIILIDISETVQKGSNSISQTKNTEIRDYIYFKVYDVTLLYEELIEMRKIKAETELKIKEIEDKYNLLQLDQITMANNSNSQDQRIIQLEQENKIFQSKNKQLEMEVDSWKNTINYMWQSYSNHLSQLILQFNFNSAQANQGQQMKNLENLETQIQVLQVQLQYLNKETDEQKQKLKQKKEKLDKANSNFFNAENHIKQQNDKIQKYEIEIIHLKDSINKQELNNSHSLSYTQDDGKNALISKENQIQKLQYSNNNLTQKIQNLELEIQQLSDSKLNVETQNNILNCKIMSLAQTIDQLNQEIQAMQIKIIRKVSDSNKGIINNNKDNEKQLESESKFKKLNEEMKEKQHQVEIQQLFDEIKIQSADILRAKQTEINQLKAEKEEQIKLIQDQNNKFEQNLNSKILQNNMLEQVNYGLYSNLEQSNQHLHMKYQENNYLTETIYNLQKSLDMEQQNSIADIEKLKSKLKQQKEQLEGFAQEGLQEIQTIVSQQKDQIKNCENEIKKLRDYIDDLEMKLQILNTKVEEATSNLQRKEIEIKKYKNINQNLNQQIEQLQSDKLQLRNEKQNLEFITSCQNQRIIGLMSNLDELDQIESDFFKNKSDFDTQTDQLRILQKQKELLDLENNDLKNSLQQQWKELQQQKVDEKQCSESKIIQLESIIAKLEQELMMVCNNNREIQDTVRQCKLKISEKEGRIMQLEIQLNQKEKKIQDLIAELQLNIKNHILSKLSNYDDTYNDKIIGIMEKIMSSPYKINQFKKDENIKFDLEEYEIFEISSDNEQAKQLLNNNQIYLFEKCLRKIPKGKVTLNRSKQPSAVSTFFKGYLSVVSEASQNEFKGKFFLIKDLNTQTQPFTTIDEAIQMSKNDFLCQFLMEQFNKVLQSEKLKEGDYRIARQFVLEIKDKLEYYYCEMVEEGEFKKINGGVFELKISEVDSYFNAFTKYVYTFSNHNYIITYLQICGKIVYDMIVSTSNKWLFSFQDQGQAEIQQVLEILNMSPMFWNEKVEKIAQKGLK
ncbi:unnamed protein product [Paramecium octaurelia]|uniref:Alpha-type protein kinase domain-containing protein n=1 Tax=Paramecium octaurelia TaxID=43137 RepID=A0A8S1YNR8_PAROT|nr:unnamed protein product [Paramecium octaurelia]